MNEAQPLDLLRPRELGDLFRDGFRAYFRYFLAFVAIGAAVVVPVELVVSGIGLGQLSGGYSSTGTTAELGITLAESYLLIGPLVTAMVVHALLVVADGRSPRPGAAITSGLEAFRPVFVAVLIGAAGVALGLFFFIIPGVYLAVRWYFAAQAVVVDGRRSVGALERSAELVAGSWWRVLGILVLVALAVGLPARLLELPFDAWAKSADSSAITLVGQIVTYALAAPVQAIILTLLYFDLLARRQLPAMVPPVQPPPDY